jgi:dihydropteroate synthase
MPNKIVGILNVTPDSFSDGGCYLNSKDALAMASKLFNEGADFIDVGADSTRPGSKCVTERIEWERLAPFVDRIAEFGNWSIDTHSVYVAKNAINCGASIINDVSGGSRQMMELAVQTNSKLVCMYSRSIGDPHGITIKQSPNSVQELLDRIEKFIEQTLDQAQQVGLDKSKIILDPGMGSFVSDDPAHSFSILNNLNKFASYGDLLIGVSRKGFLKSLQIESFQERDWVGGIVSAIATKINHPLNDIYWRVHNVPIQKAIFNLISV